MRMTPTLVKVFQALLEDPDGRHWGYKLCRKTDLPNGVMYPTLAQLERMQFLHAAWEDQASCASGRPPRRYYVLTESGKLSFEALLEEARRDPKLSFLFRVKA